MTTDPEVGAETRTGGPGLGTAEGGTRLTGHLGTAGIVLMVVAAAAPLTTLGGNVPLMIVLGRGTGAPVGFLVAGAVLLLFSVGFVAMTPHVRESGAFYAYVHRGLGEPAGMGAALVAFGAYSATLIGVYGYLGGVLSALVSQLGGPFLPWWTWAAVVLLVVTWFGRRRIELSARVLGTALVCEVGIVVVFDVVVLARGGAEGIVASSFTPAGIGGGLGVAVLFSLFGFLGFESTAIYRDEAKDPERTIPRATYWAVVVIAAFYALSSWSMIEGWGPSTVVAGATEDPDGFLLTVIGDYLGIVGRDVAQVLLLGSLMAAALSFHNIVVRYQLVLVEHGLLPRKVGEIHPRHHAPSVSSLVQSATAAAFLVFFAALGLDPLLQVFGTMAGVSIVGMVLLWILTSVSVLVFFLRLRQEPGSVVRPARMLLAPALATVALVASLWLILANLPLIVGGTTALAVVLGVVPLAFFAVGWGLSLSRRRRRNA